MNCTTPHAIDTDPHPSYGGNIPATANGVEVTDQPQSSQESNQSALEPPASGRNLRHRFRFSFEFLLLSALLAGFPNTSPGQPDILWTRTFGGFVWPEFAYSVRQTNDDGFIIGGSNGGGDVWVIKTDQDGNTLWTLVHDFGYGDVCRSVRQTDDGGYVVAGETGLTGRDVLLLKLSPSGDVLWEQSYDIGHLGSDVGSEVEPTSDGGYILCGTTEPPGPGSPFPWLMKTDSTGNLRWRVAYPEGLEAYAVEETDDGGFVVAGETPFGTGTGDAYFVRTESHGQILWTKTYDGGYDDQAFDIKQTGDGGFIAAGVHDYYDALLLRMDENGDTVWTRRYSFGTRNELRSVVQTPDGGFVAAGEITGGIDPASHEALLMKVDANGDLEWMYRSLFQSRAAYSLDQTSDGGYVIAGYHFVPYNFDMFVSRFASDVPTQVWDTDAGIPVGLTLQQNYPNPFNPTTTFSFSLRSSVFANLSIYDLLGREIATLVNEKFAPGTYTREWDATGRPSGVYFYRLQAGGFTETKKLMLLR